MRHLFNSHCINKKLWAFDVSENQVKCFVTEIWETVLQMHKVSKFLLAVLQTYWLHKENMYDIKVLIWIKWALNTCRGHLMKVEALWAVLFLRLKLRLSFKEPHFYILIQFVWMCRQWKASFPREAKLKPRSNICSSTSFLLLSQLANFNHTRCTECLKDNDICGCAGFQCLAIAPAAAGQRRFLHWAPPPPAPPERAEKAGSMGWSGRSCGLEGTSPWVSSQVAPRPQHHQCPLCQCPALLLGSGAPLGLSPEIRETRH